MRQRIKAWLRRHRRRPHLDDGDRPPLEDKDVKEAMRRHAISSRLVRFRAAKSAKALRDLNAILALRVKALEGISAAEDALDLLDRRSRDDK